MPDPRKWPNGINAVSDQIHDMGLKFGLYGCAGDKTCAGFPGSEGHEASDVAQLAGWGVDFWYGRPLVLLFFSFYYLQAKQSTMTLSQEIRQLLHTMLPEPSAPNLPQPYREHQILVRPHAGRYNKRPKNPQDSLQPL